MTENNNWFPKHNLLLNYLIVNELYNELYNLLMNYIIVIDK